MVGALGGLGLGAAPALAAPSSVATTAPSVSAPVMTGHTGPYQSGAGSTQPAAMNVVSASCPNETPGAICTVYYKVNTGSFATQFCYEQNGVNQCLPPYNGNCPYTACFYNQSGGGGNPPVIPLFWVVAGNSAKITNIT